MTPLRRSSFELGQFITDLEHGVPHRDRPDFFRRISAGCEGCETQRIVCSACRHRLLGRRAPTAASGAKLRDLGEVTADQLQLLAVAIAEVIPPNSSWATFPGRTTYRRCRDNPRDRAMQMAPVPSPAGALGVGSPPTNRSSSRSPSPGHPMSPPPSATRLSLCAPPQAPRAARSLS